MSRYSRADLSSKVYVGNLGDEAGRRELEEEFSKFGPLKSVWVARNPPGFAFVEFEDSRDAEDACKTLDNSMVCGHRAVVEMSSGEKRNRGDRGGRGGRPMRSAGSDDKCYSCGERGHFARDCRGGSRNSGGGYGGGRYGGGGGGGYGGGGSSSSSRRRSGRSRSRSRERSYSPRRQTERSRSRSKSRSHSPKRRRSSSDRD